MPEPRPRCWDRGHVPSHAGAYAIARANLPEPRRQVRRRLAAEGPVA